jgi:hypothetical protein
MAGKGIRIRCREQTQPPATIVSTNGRNEYLDFLALTEALAAIATPMKILGFSSDKVLPKNERAEPSRVRAPSADKVGLLQKRSPHPAFVRLLFHRIDAAVVPSTA